MDIKKKLSNTEFLNREYNISHMPYEREMAFFQSIKTGDVNETQRLFKPLNSKELGKLSDNKLRNLKYHLIITVAFITRYCIEGGMEMETAYNLSDIMFMLLTSAVQKNRLIYCIGNLLTIILKECSYFIKQIFIQNLLLCVLITFMIICIQKLLLKSFLKLQNSVHLTCLNFFIKK